MYLLKSHISASSYTNAHGTVVNRQEHEDSRASALDKLRSHPDHKIRSYARKILGSQNSYDLYAIKRDRFGHLPHWNKLDEHTRQAVLDAEEEKTKGHKSFEEWKEKAHGKKKDAEKVDRSGWEQQLMFKSRRVQHVAYILRKSKHDVTSEKRDSHGRWTEQTFQSGEETIIVKKTGSKPDDIVTFNGNKNLAMLPLLNKGRDKIFPPLPIRLKVGKDEHKFGEDHIAKKHAKELKQYEMEAAEYIFHVIKNTSKIYDVTRDNKLLLECRNRPSGSMFIQLKADRGYYSIVTTFDNIRGRDKGEEVWSGRNVNMTPNGHENPFEKATTANQSARLFPKPDHRQSIEMLPKSALAVLGSQTNNNISPTDNKLKKSRNLYLIKATAAK